MLDIDPSNADALHNWGKVLYSDGAPTHTHAKKSLDISFTFLFKKKGLLTQKAMEMRSVYDLTRQVDMYLELFCTFALKCTQLITNPFLKKKPHSSQTRTKSVSRLRWLSRN